MTDENRRCETCEYWYRRKKQWGECVSEDERRRQKIRVNTRYSTVETDPACLSWIARKKVPF